MILVFIIYFEPLNEGMAASGREVVYADLGQTFLLIGKTKLIRNLVFNNLHRNVWAIIANNSWSSENNTKWIFFSFDFSVFERIRYRSDDVQAREAKHGIYISVSAIKESLSLNTLARILYI